MALKNPLKGLFNPTPPPPPPRSAVPVAVKRPRVLTASDFVAGRQVVGAPSRVASFTVPRGEVFQLNGVQPFRFHIKGMVQQLEMNRGTGPVIMRATGSRPVRSERRHDGAGSDFTNHPDFVAWYKVAGSDESQWQQHPIQRADFSNPADPYFVLTQLPETESEAYDYKLYYLIGEGDMRIVAAQPAGTDTRNTVLYNDTFLSLHETNQAQGDTAPRFVQGGKNTYSLGPKWQLGIEATTGAVIEWDDKAQHVIAFPGHRLPVSVQNTGRLNAQVSGRLS